MATKKEASFEEQLLELERIIEQMDQSDTPLEKSIALYERGMELKKSCEKMLSGYERRIQKVEGDQEVPLEGEEG